MLHRVSDKVKTCYSRAVAAREQALRTQDPAKRARLFKIEDNWISLAQSYQLTECLDDFGEEVRRFLKRPAKSDI